MAIKVGQGFQRTGAFAIDESLVLTKAQMLAMNDNLMPDIYFALCKDDNKIYIYKKDATPDPVTGKYSVMSTTGGDPIGYDFTTNITVGGIAEGTDIAATDEIADLLKSMLLTTYYPTYTAPSASLTVPTVLAEVGQTVTQNITLNYNAGAITLRNTKQADRGGAATNYHIETSGADTEINEDSVSSGVFSDTAIARATRGNVTVSGTVSYGEGAQPKDSNGADFETPLAAGTVTTTKTIEFIFPFYWGASDSATPDLATLTKDLSKKGNKTYYYTTNDQYIVFAYDRSYGDLTSILDQNGFETISGYNKTTVGDFYVYVSDLPTTDTDASNTFKF